MKSASWPARSEDRRSDSFARQRLGRAAFTALRAGCFAALVVLLPSSAPRAEPGETRVGVVTPWPQVLPCRAFSNVRFEVFMPVGPGNSIPAAMDVRWGPATGPAQTFHGDMQRPFSGNPLDTNFPPAEAPRFAVPASDWTRMNILLHCAGQPKLGVEWSCQNEKPRKSGKPCTVQVAYPDEERSWPDFESDEDLLRAKPGPIPTTPTLRNRVGEVLAATAKWVDQACRDGRCSPAIAAARSHLDPFLRTTPTLRSRLVTLRKDGCAHGVLVYEHLDVKASAGDEHVSIGMDWEQGWQISFGSGAHTLRCQEDGCTMKLDGSLGTYAHTELGGFLIHGEALAVRP